MLLIPSVNDASSSNMVFSKLQSSWSDVNECEKNNNNPVKNDILRTPSSRCTFLAKIIYFISFFSLTIFAFVCCCLVLVVSFLPCVVPFYTEREPEKKFSPMHFQVQVSFSVVGVSNLQICISPSDFHVIFPFHLLRIHLLFDVRL